MAKFNPARRSVLIGSGTALLLAKFPVAAFAQSPTAVCSRVGQKIISKGKNYICVKSNGKLQWQALVPAKPPISLHPSKSSGGTAPAPATSPSKVNGYFVANISELSEGVSKIVVAKNMQGQSVSIALYLSGKVVTAHSTVCTHMGCTVGAAGKQLDCPCHGSVFDAQTGAVVNGPAQSPLQSYQVAQVGNEIYITN